MQAWFSPFPSSSRAVRCDEGCVILKDYTPPRLPPGSDFFQPPRLLALPVSAWGRYVRMIERVWGALRTAVLARWGIHRGSGRWLPGDDRSIGDGGSTDHPQPGDR